MVRKFTWKKEKLKSRKRIERVFKEGKSFSLFPYRVYFLIGSGLAGGVGLGSAGDVGPAPAGGVGGAPVGDSGLGAVGAPPASPTPVAPTPVAASRGAALQAGFGASRRNFKRAVDRNRIKRLSREGYRLQKEPLLRRLQEKGTSMDVFFIYTGKDLPAYTTVAEKIGVALQKLIKEIR